MYRFCSLVGLPRFSDLSNNAIAIRHPTEPTCSYDPIEGLHLAPDTVENPVDKVKVLESQIGSRTRPLLLLGV